MSIPDDLLEFIAQVLLDAELPHALIGGHAINVFLEPRFTADIDLTVGAVPEALDRVRAALEANGYRVTAEHGAGLPSGPDFIRFSRQPNDPPIEFQVAKTKFQEVVIERARPTGSGPAVATVEDLIVLKLIAHRAKDLIDIAGLVRLPQVDWDHVEEWAREWDVLDRLSRIRVAETAD